MLVISPSKDGEDVAYEGRNGLKGVSFPPESASFVFVIITIEIFFPICNSTWRVNNYVFRHVEGRSHKEEKREY